MSGFPKDVPSGSLANYLPLAGGAMTGALLLAADPVAALGATTKQYTDALALRPFGLVSTGGIYSALVATFAPGIAVFPDGTTVVNGNNTVSGALGLGLSSTNWLYLKSDGTITFTAGAAPIYVAGRILLSKVVVDGAGAMIITDQRPLLAEERRAGRILAGTQADATVGGAGYVANTDTTLISLAIPANVCQAGDLIRLVAGGDLLSTGFTSVFTFKFKLGATTVLDSTGNGVSVTTSASTGKWALSVDIAIVATNSQKVTGVLPVSQRAAVTWPLSTGSSGGQGPGYGTAAEDLTAAKNAILSVAIDQSSANVHIDLRHAELIFNPS